MKYAITVQFEMNIPETLDAAAKEAVKKEIASNWSAMGIKVLSVDLE